MTRPPKRRLMIIGKEVRINRAKKIKVSIDRLMMARLLQAGLVQLTTNLDYDPIGHFLYLTVDTEALTGTDQRNLCCPQFKLLTRCGSTHVSRDLFTSH